MNDESHISHSMLRQQAIAHKSGQQMLPHYLPQEGRPGQGGPDAHTELQGFHRDYDRVIAPLLTKYAQGGARQDIGRTLTQLAAVQKSNSCGPYLRATMLELRDVIAPNYLHNLARQRLTPTSVDVTLTAIQAGRPVDGAETVLADLRTELTRRPETKPDLQARLSSLADDYARSGDDYMAETASILAERSRGAVATMEREQIAATVAALQRQEAQHDFSQSIDYSPRSQEPQHPFVAPTIAGAQHIPRR